VLQISGSWQHVSAALWPSSGRKVEVMSSDHHIIKQHNNNIASEYTRVAVTYMKHISLPVHRLNVMLVV